MRHDASHLALRNLERLIAKDPLLRDIVNPTLPDVRRAARFSPAVDVIETPERWVLLLEVPGIKRESLHVRLEGTRLVVSGEKPALRPGGKARVAERETGAFSREFLLPFQVLPEGIRANLVDGVLTVSVPRTSEAAAREVPIEEGEPGPDDREA